MFFEYPFTAAKFQRVLDSLNILQKDFAEISRATGKSWVTRLLRIDGDLSFAATSRVYMGYSLQRYKRLNENFVADDEYRLKAKAELLDQLMAEALEVVKVAGHGANKDLIRN